MLVMMWFSGEITGIRKVQRSDGKGTELLVQLGLVKAIRADGCQELCALMSKARALDKGKTALHVCNVAKGLLPMLREQGRAGLAIDRYAADMALCSALGQRLHQRHVAYDEDGPPMASGAAVRLLRLADWSW